MINLNSDYKRLTNNNLEEDDPEYDFCIGCEFYGKYYSCDRPNGICANFERFIGTYNRLVELENKIEKKTLIDLPCKVGDTVYRKDGAWQVVGFECNRANGWLVKLERWKDRFLDCHETTKVVFSAFGKTVFPTEAEMKLRVKGEVFQETRTSYVFNKETNI